MSLSSPGCSRARFTCFLSFKDPARQGLHHSPCIVRTLRFKESKSASQLEDGRSQLCPAMNWPACPLPRADQAMRWPLGGDGVERNRLCGVGCAQV